MSLIRDAVSGYNRTYSGLGGRWSRELWVQGLSCTSESEGKCRGQKQKSKNNKRAQSRGLLFAELCSPVPKCMLKP